MVNLGICCAAKEESSLARLSGFIVEIEIIHAMHVI
jgi:hypothetical protein